MGHFWEGEWAAPISGLIGAHVKATDMLSGNAKGEIVDPWGTPMQFYFSHNEVLIRSAGPNKVWEDNAISTADDLYRYVGDMARAATLYRDTGGMHACGLAFDGELRLVREDVGRHNALDKLAWMRKERAW